MKALRTACLLVLTVLGMFVEIGVGLRYEFPFIVLYIGALLVFASGLGLLIYLDTRT